MSRISRHNLQMRARLLARNRFLLHSASCLLDGELAKLVIPLDSTLGQPAAVDVAKFLAAARPPVPLNLSLIFVFGVPAVPQPLIRRDVLHHLLVIHEGHEAEHDPEAHAVHYRHKVDELEAYEERSQVVLVRLLDVLPPEHLVEVWGSDEPEVEGTDSGSQPSVQASIEQETDEVANVPPPDARAHPRAVVIVNLTAEATL